MYPLLTEFAPLMYLLEGNFNDIVHLSSWWFLLAIICRLIKSARLLWVFLIQALIWNWLRKQKNQEIDLKKKKCFFSLKREMVNCWVNYFLSRLFEIGIEWEAKIFWITFLQLDIMYIIWSLIRLVNPKRIFYELKNLLGTKNIEKFESEIELIVEYKKTNQYP